MSYQVIARKWRPKNFSELVGQSHVSQTLLNALRNDRLPHALLFTGPRGTGKTSSARILAKSLRCPNAVDYVPCHECRDCQDVATGRSIDVIEIDGASNNGVDSIRELRETISYMPSSGKYKLYIVDEVHMLSTSAFNALLKTLEEPPSHVIFVMATTEVHKIPNTILSRCQRFDFRRIPVKAIATRLAEICQADGVKTSEEALWLIARQGDGSMRDSQSLLDQVITFCGSSLTREKAVEVLGLTDRTLLLETIESLTKRDTRRVVDIIERVFTAGYDAKIFVQDLLEELRHLLIVKITDGSTSGIVDLPDSEVVHLKSLAKDLSEEDVHLLFDMALKGANDLLRSQDTRVVLEMLLLRMASAPRVVDILSLAGPTEQAVPVQGTAPQRVTSQKLSPSPTGQASSSAPRTITSEPAAHMNTGISTPASGSIEAKWSDLITRVKRVNPMVSAKLEHTALVAINGKVIHLSVPDQMKFLSGQIEDKEFQKKLLNYIGTFWGPGFSIEVSTTKGDGSALSPKAMEEKKKQDDVNNTRQQVENHPFVQSTQKVFKSQIKTIKEIP